LRRWIWLGLAVAGALLYAWKRESPHFILVHADHEISDSSAYPLAVNPNLVGSYPISVGSGAGYFYDEILEYRVWLNPSNGAEKLNGDSDYCEAFAQYEKAKEFSTVNKGVEEPLVLVRQIEWISEPEPGHYIPEKGERLAEWQIPWLDGNKGTSESIQEFIKHPKPVPQ
jgi:putative acetyltransferase